jgi:hypothetical protein
VLVLVRSARDPQPVIAEGEWHGEILAAPRGAGGFGYDPLFFVPSGGCSSAELPAEQPRTPSATAPWPSAASPSACARRSDGAPRHPIAEGRDAAPGDGLAALPPLSLYVHFPWCLQQVPLLRLQFARGARGGGIPEPAYLAALIADLEQSLPRSGAGR